MFFFSFFWWGISTRMIEAFRNTPERERERERRAEKRLSTWLSCNTSDYIFKHLKRRHLSVVYVPVSILLDAFFFHFILTEEQQSLECFQKLQYLWRQLCLINAPYRRNSSQFSMTCPVELRVLSCGSGWAVETALEMEGGVSRSGGHYCNRVSYRRHEKNRPHPSIESSVSLAIHPSIDSNIQPIRKHHHETYRMCCLCYLRSATTTIPTS